LGRRAGRDDARHDLAGGHCQRRRPHRLRHTKKIYILRDEAGKHEKIPVHYKEALKGDSELNLVLKPGDTIVVP
jgi:hypothetical protein